ncbi:recombinase family protein [Bosea sp. LC85]|uniref:recombinase family protein n=1 Tax=Bosea sp. LC85 TaxID=1502851 RepID=UPI001FCC3566|nr:recombinase family protein [Bosea sp. LC85]
MFNKSWTIENLHLFCFKRLFHNAWMIYGYARVSTDGQTLEGQIERIKFAGVQKIFCGKASAATMDRPELTKLLTSIGDGDVLIVARLDRLARSTRDLLLILDELGKRAAGFRSLADTWADTTTPHGRLVTTMMAGFAEFERSLILARTHEGRARAKARGVKLGRPYCLTPHQRQEARSRKAVGEPVRDIARSYNVSPSTISRL